MSAENIRKRRSGVVAPQEQVAQPQAQPQDNVRTAEVSEPQGQPRSGARQKLEEIRQRESASQAPPPPMKRPTYNLQGQHYSDVMDRAKGRERYDPAVANPQGIKGRQIDSYVNQQYGRQFGQTPDAKAYADMRATSGYDSADLTEEYESADDIWKPNGPADSRSARQFNERKEQAVPIPTRESLEGGGTTNPNEQLSAIEDARAAEIQVGDTLDTAAMNPKLTTTDKNEGETNEQMSNIVQTAMADLNAEKKQGGEMFGEFGDKFGLQSGRELTTWVETINNRFDEYMKYKNMVPKGKKGMSSDALTLLGMDKDSQERYAKLDNYFKSARGKKSYEAAMAAMKMLARSPDTAFTAAIYDALEQSSFRDYVHEIAPVIRKAIVEYEATIRMDPLVKSMSNAQTTEYAEIKKSLDEMRKALDTIQEMKKALDELPELKKSMDALLKDGEDFKDIFIWVDDRLSAIEKAKDEEDDEDEEEDEKMPPVKKFAEGVPKSPNGMSSDTDAPVMKGKQNDIDMNSKEDAGLKGAKPQKLTGGKSTMEVHVAENQKLVKSFEEGKKVGEIEAMKKAAEFSDIETPQPGAVAEPNRRLEPLAKADQDLMNLSWGKIERLHREGKL